MTTNKSGHIRLTSHPGGGSPSRFPIRWGEADAHARGPVIATVNSGADRNAIGAHGGSYALYRALAVSAGVLNPIARPDLTNTHPVISLGPFPQWSEPGRIVSLDPFGHLVPEVFAREIAEGIDIRPSIAITKARLTVPELRDRLRIDGTIVRDVGDVTAVKIAIDPVWHLPGIAARFGTSETNLRRTLFEQTGGMYPELVTRPDLAVFLPPIGNITVYLFGDVARLGHERTFISGRLHDECNGSDVFGSDICTCRPYLVHGIEEAVRDAQNGGVGFIVYNRKEGRALGEVTKFLVYNARKRQDGGDQAATYFERTECVAGVQDARFQQLMPDVMHWLGIRRIDRFMSMSNMKHDALVAQGIDIVERVPIPEGLIPPDASVEMEAKKAAGYFAPEGAPSAADLKDTVGRRIEDF
jgi:GTP cyclohydrolase II